MNAIVMMDYDHTIGINGDQIIHIPDDLKRFKDLTTNKTIVYGRKTLEQQLYVKVKKTCLLLVVITLML